MKMAPRLHILICVLGLFNVAASADPEFPKLEELEVVSYTTEVQVTDTARQDTAYAAQYYDNLTDTGALEIIVDGQIINVYYNNQTYEILEVNATTCQVWKVDESQYGLEGVFYGWLNKNPLVIGPAAPLFYAQTRRSEVKFLEIEEVRDIPCEKYALGITGPKENVVMYFYFAQKDWITPYQYKDLRVPIRIRATGNTSKGLEKGVWAPVDIVTDFAYFKPSVDYDLDLQPPVGLGCSLRTKTDVFPKIPRTFQYSAEVVDLLYEAEHNDVDVRFERVWYDGIAKIARLDMYKKTTSLSSFQDYNTGVMYEYTKEHNCRVSPLKNAMFEKYDVGMVGGMKDEKEVLNLDGKFYDMGQRKIRGLTCDTYESVEREVFYKEWLDRLVVTAYFTEDYTKVGVNGVEEERIPVVIMLTGWRSATEMAFKLQYNIFAFSGQIWPEMYSDFGMEECHTKTDSKAYFVLMMQVDAKGAAKMEEQNELVSRELRSLISKYAVVPDWRIPFIKVDYKTTGVFATGMMVERPPALLQFYQFDSGREKANENDIAAVEAATLEDCANACIDYSDPCKGFYFCNAACLVKLTDPSEKPDEGDKEILLGQCDEYIRAERDSSNFHNTPLLDALEKLETAILNGTLEVMFEIPDGEEIVKVSDIVIGDGPYTGVDSGDKPYVVNVEYRKLDPALPSSQIMKDVEMLNDCYKKCQAAGSGCSSFSFCGRTSSKDKQCIISSDMIVRGRTNDLQFIPSSECDIYDLKYLEYFTKYPEQVSFISGYSVIKSVDTLEHCAKNCRLEEKGKCRGFEYCRSMKTCSLHTKHILDLKPGEVGTVTEKNPCVHYAARFIADYADMGQTLVDDNSNVRYTLSLEECARVCSEELGDSCKSFNYCPTSRGTCALSRKVLKDDGITTTETKDCKHYEKREGVKDWSNAKAKDLSKSGFTSKGFTGLVVGMLVLGLIVGALGFVAYSCIRSRQSGEGMSVRFMKQET